MNPVLGQEVLEQAGVSIYPAPWVPTDSAAPKLAAGTALVIAVGACRQDGACGGGGIRHGIRPRIERVVRQHRQAADAAVVIAQVEVEDLRLGNAKYLVERLKVETVELRMEGMEGPGVERRRIFDLDEAVAASRRGERITPNPEDSRIQAAFRADLFPCFVRHAALGAMDHERFLEAIEGLRHLGARQVGAYLPVEGRNDLELALLWASDARLDLLSLETPGAGDGYPRFDLVEEACELAAGYADCGKRVPALAIAADFADMEAARQALAQATPFFRVARFK